MLISEIFYSIQGEGILSGVPSTFVRTSGCNLRCKWCDSKYASWHPESKDLSVETIESQIASYPTRFCVITGGEPMIADSIHILANHLGTQGKHVTIETAATIPPSAIFCSLASLSPKLANSAPDSEESQSVRERHERLRLRLDVIREWIDGYDYQLKFVVCSGADIEEIVTLLESLNRNIPPEKVLLMPQGVSHVEIAAVTDLVVSACKEHGFRFCDRLHVRLFGNTRGT